VRLNTDAVDQATALQNADDMEVGAPRVRVVLSTELIDEELRVWERFARHLERGDYPVPSRRAVPAESGRKRRSRMDGLVDDVDRPGVGISLTVQGNPLLDFGQLLSLRQRGDPTRELRAPDEVVRFELEAMLLRKVVDGIQWRPVESSVGAFHGAPLASILRRYLVPKRGEVRRRGVRGDGAAEELALPFRDLCLDVRWQHHQRNQRERRRG